jgi:hypothetical protein
VSIARSLRRELLSLSPNVYRSLVQVSRDRESKTNLRSTSAEEGGGAASEQRAQRRLRPAIAAWP